MDEAIATIVEDLRLKLGSHSAAARAIGISIPGYRGIRNGWLPLTERTKALLILKHKELLGDTEGKAGGN